MSSAMWQTTTPLAFTSSSQNMCRLVPPGHVSVTHDDHDHRLPMLVDQIRRICPSGALSSGPASCWHSMNLYPRQPTLCRRCTFNLHGRQIRWRGGQRVLHKGMPPSTHTHTHTHTHVRSLISDVVAF